MNDMLDMNVPIVAFDVETTDSDPHKAGIVQYGIAAQASPDKPVKKTCKIVNCPEEITEGAMEIHGITNEEKQEGQDLDEALKIIFKSLSWAVSHSGIIVAYNMPFDWTVLTRAANQRRYTPHPHLYVQRAALYDPLLVDRRVDKYRKGKRDLTTLLNLFGLETTSPDISHDAGRDAEATLLIAREQLGIYSSDLTMPLSKVTSTMQHWYMEWADDFEQYLRKDRDPDAELNKSYPLIPTPLDREEDFEDDSPPFDPTV